MVARLARFFLVVQLLIAAAIGFGLRQALPAWPAFTCGLLAVLCGRAVIAANNFRLAARHADAKRPTPLGWRGAIALYLRELASTLISSSWHMPFRPIRGMQVHDGAAPPVLLLHGYGCNSGYWRPLHRHLCRARITHLAIDLEPALAGIDDYIPQVDAAVDALCEASGQSRVIIVGHSMGGLVARTWVRTCGQARLARLITLGTPHGGTVLAHFGPGANSRQMRRAAAVPRRPAGQPRPACSEWLIALHAAPGQTDLPLVSLYSHHDNIVAPASSAVVDGARNIGFTGIGHVALGSHPAVVARVMELIRMETASRLREPVAAAQPATSIQEKPSC